MVWVDFWITAALKKKFFLSPLECLHLEQMTHQNTSLQIKQKHSVSSTMAFTVLLSECLITWLQYFLNEVGWRNCWTATLLKLYLLYCLHSFHFVGDAIKGRMCRKTMSNNILGQDKFVPLMNSEYWIFNLSVDIYLLNIMWWKCLLDLLLLHGLYVLLQ